MRLSYRSYGDPDRAVVVLLHGLLGSRDNWHSVAKRYADEFRIIAADLVNHGESPHVEYFDYASMARDILDLLDSIDLKDAVFVGHSMGGKVAMEIALSAPGRVRGIVVEDMVPGETTPRYLELVKVLGKLDVSNIGTRREAEDLLSHDVPDRTVRLFLLKNLTRDEAGFRWRANLGAIEACYRYIWAPLASGRTYTGPSLFVRGGKSDTVSDEHIPETRVYFPSAEIRTVPEAGHWVHAMYQGSFDDYVLPFLRDIPTS